MLAGERIRIWQRGQFWNRHLIEKVPFVLRNRQELLNEAHEAGKPHRRYAGSSAEERAGRRHRVSDGEPENGHEKVPEQVDGRTLRVP